MSSHLHAPHSGDYLEFVKQDNWEYVRRVTGRDAVIILPVLDSGHILLVEQYRIPVGGYVLEFPAGLVGDVDDGEALETAAARELEEETGYRAHELVPLASGPSSPGLADEIVHVYLARQLEHVHEGGGDDSEAIDVHAVARDRLDDWLAQHRQAGRHIDIKVYTGLYFIDRETGTNDGK